MKEKVDPEEFGVTPSLFLEWRSPRFGVSNPTRMDNKVWEWLIKSKIGAYEATKTMNGPSPIYEGPTWCFDRFGQTSTTLPDGRIILISGEHEDHYDPDFYIYNDVVISNPNGTIEIYGYPEEIFPSTDFHTATLVDNSIIIIGNLGFPKNRIIGQTQVYHLNLENFAIQKIDTYGHCPGWINDHTAILSEDLQAITIENGMLYLGKNYPYTENIDEWQLCINTWHWKRLTRKNWQRWEIKRRDHKMHHVDRIRQALWYREENWQENYHKYFKQIIDSIGKEPNFDLFKSLYIPDIPHIKKPENEDEHRVCRITIDNVIVRYVEEWQSIQVTVEGDLPDITIEALKADLLNKFSLLENTECYIENIDQNIKP